MHIKKFFNTLEEKLKMRQIEKAIHDIGSFNIMNKKTENVLLSLLVLCIILLFAAQIGLNHKSVRTFFTDIEEYEGVNVDELDEIFKDSEISLQLLDVQPSDKIKILVNGMEINNFSESVVNIPIRNNCVIEIDGTGMDIPFRVKVIKVSKNLPEDLVGKEVTINSNISVLSKVFIK